jgi:hypothetical protein
MLSSEGWEIGGSCGENAGKDLMSNKNLFLI